MVLTQKKISKVFSAYRGLRSRIIENRVSQLRGLLDGVTSIREGMYDATVSDLKEGFLRLSGPILSFKEKKGRYVREYAPDFNIFKILNPRELENRHSDFLGFLLDPKKGHGQGTLFVDWFIKHCVVDRGLNMPEGVSVSLVRREALSPLRNIDDSDTDVDAGRSDILVEFSGSLRFAFIIENKVRAVDQPRQLGRYYDAAKNTYGEGNFLLFYLTPKGGDPSEGSISEARLKKLKDQRTLTLLSYARDVVGWLEEALKHIEARRVRETVDMYLSVIREL
jgi:hypothetical protein